MRQCAELKSYDFVSSSLGIIKVNFVSALAHSSTLKEGELFFFAHSSTLKEGEFIHWHISILDN